MKILTRIGTRLRLEPCISSLVTKTYINNGIELNLISKEVKEDGVWYYVSEGTEKGWLRFDFVKRIFDDE